MRLLINLDVLLASPRRLAQALSPQPLPDKPGREFEQRIIGQQLVRLFVQPRRVVCLRRRDYAGQKPFRYHLRPSASLARSADGANRWVGLICEYDEALRVLRAVKWEPITPLPLSPQERVFQGEVCLAGFNFGVGYSDSPAVAFLNALPEEAADLSEPLAQWRDYLDWRKTLAREKGAFRYAYNEAEVLSNRTSIRFHLKEPDVVENLRQRFANEELKVLGLQPQTSNRILQGGFKGVRMEARRTPGAMRSGGGADRAGHSAADSRGGVVAVSIVLEFDHAAGGDLRVPEEGFLQLAMEGEIASIDVQMQGIARLGEGRALNPRLPLWLFDIAQAAPVPPARSDWQPDRKLNPEQRACVGRALALEDVLLLWGPPGTGKTTVIAEVCSQLVRGGQRVLISSQANLAVIQALDRLPRLPHVRPIFVSSAKNRDGGASQASDYIASWLRAIGESAGAAAELETDAAWRALLGDWEKRLAATSADDVTPTLEHVYIKHANVVGATCNETGKAEFLTSKLLNPAFDLAIVDEVSKATPPEMLLPMLLGRRVMLVGDHRQLPPMFRDVTFEEARENADVTPEAVEQFREMVTASLFERYFRAAPPSVRCGLRRQYRMHPQIMAAVNHFYADSPLQAGDGDAEYIQSKQHGLQLRGARGFPWLRPTQHFVWIDTARDAEGLPVREASYGTSRKNAIEAAVCAGIVASLFREHRGPPLELAVISFYKAQVGLLRERLREARLDQAPGFDLNRDVNTVDQFQGSERDVVIVSLVRTGPRLTGEFVRDFRRINVAFSRARKLLIVLASRETFARSEVEVPSAADGAGESQRVYAHIHDLARAAGATFSVAELGMAETASAAASGRGRS